MAETYYAWSPIRHGGAVDKETKVISGVKTVAFGEKVTASQLSLSDEEFKSLIEGGAVRASKPPAVPNGYTGSPIQFLRDQIKAAGDLGTNTGGSYFTSPEEDDALAMLAGVEPPTSEKESK